MSKIRAAVADANARTVVVVETTMEDDGIAFKTEKTLREWLDWDRGDAKRPGPRTLEEQLWISLKGIHDRSLQSGLRAGTLKEGEAPSNYVYSVPVSRPTAELTRIYSVHKRLDSAKSVVNATQTIEIE